MSFRPDTDPKLLTNHLSCQKNCRYLKAANLVSGEEMTQTAVPSCDWISRMNIAGVVRLPRAAPEVICSANCLNRNESAGHQGHRPVHFPKKPSRRPMLMGAWVAVETRSDCIGNTAAGDNEVPCEIASCLVNRHLERIAGAGLSIQVGVASYDRFGAQCMS